MRTPALYALLLTAALPAQGLGLERLAALARERAARQRPALEAALQPFLADLALEYSGENRAYLDGRFDTIAAVEPSLVPLLLEMLTPADTDEATRTRADNAARALVRIGPASFPDPLIELARGRDGTARRHALYLLGFSGSERAIPVLVAQLEARNDEDRVAALTGLRRLASPRAIEPIADRLTDPSRAVRSLAIRTLIETDERGAAADAVVEAFAKEQSASLVEHYIEYFARHVRGNEKVTLQLLSLVTGSLPLDDRIALARALGQIAPEKHSATIEALERIVDEGLVGDLEKAAALSLLDLDEKSGVKTISDRLEQSIRRRRDDSDAYAARADWLTELERWRDAIRDYEAAIKHSRSGSRRAALWLDIARCEAHRGKITRMCSAIQKSEVARETVEREAARDPVFAEALQNDSVQRFLRRLD